jgi:hypothetical protein
LLGVLLVLWISLLAPARGRAQEFCAPQLLSSTLDGSTLDLELATSAQCLEGASVWIEDQQRDFDVVPGDPPPARVVIAVDDSSSLGSGDQSIVAQAVDQLLDELDPATEVALVSFGNGAVIDVPATTDHHSIVSAIRRLEPGGGAALYSAVVEATEALTGAEGPGLIVLLTYGWDWGNVSTTGAGESLALVASRGVPVYVQSLAPFDEDVDYLTALATDGQTHPNVAIFQLAAAIDQIPPAQSDRYHLTVDVDGIPEGAHSAVLFDAYGNFYASSFFSVAPPPPPAKEDLLTEFEVLGWPYTFTGESPSAEPASDVATAQPPPAPSPVSLPVAVAAAFDGAPGAEAPTQQLAPPEATAVPVSQPEPATAPSSSTAPKEPTPSTLLQFGALLFVIFALRRFRVGIARSADKADSKVRHHRHGLWLTEPWVPSLDAPDDADDADEEGSDRASAA